MIQPCYHKAVGRTTKASPRCKPLRVQRQMQMRHAARRGYIRWVANRLLAWVLAGLLVVVGLAGRRSSPVDQAIVTPSGRQSVGATAHVRLMTMPPSKAMVDRQHHESLFPQRPPDVLPSSSNDSAFLLQDDRLVAVTAIIVIETRPNVAAETAHFLHARYAFVQELVLWNNFNVPMNPHLLPYDLPVRYITSPHNYGAYARALACLLARHDLCYFQHEALRTPFLSSMFATWLSVIAVLESSLASKAALPVVALQPTTLESHRIDWNAGVLAHKDVLRQHVRMLSSSASSRGNITIDDTDFGGGRSSDLLLSDQVWVDDTAVLLMTTQTSHRDAAVGNMSMSPHFYSRQPPYSDLKAPCADGSCTLATNMLLATSTSSYYNLVDQDERTFAQLLLRGPAVDDVPIRNMFPPYIALEMSKPTVVTGMRLAVRGVVVSYAYGEDSMVDAPAWRLEYLTWPRAMTTTTNAYQAAEHCVQTGEPSYLSSSSSSPMMILTITCATKRVSGARVVFLGTPLRSSIAIAEVAVMRLHLSAVASKDASSGIMTTMQVAVPPRLLDDSTTRVTYIFSASQILARGTGASLLPRLDGSTVSLLEEACELSQAFARARAVRIVAYVDSSADWQQSESIARNQLADAFAIASGSTCDLRSASVGLQIIASGDKFLPLSSSPSATDVLFVWVRSRANLRDRVLRHLVDAQNRILIARIATDSDLQLFQDDKLLSTFDGFTLPSKRALELWLVHPDFSLLDVRITYALRTFPTTSPARVPTPANPHLEELLVLMTPTTRQQDVALFDAHAIPMLISNGVAIRRVDLNELAAWWGESSVHSRRINTAETSRAPDDLDATMQMPKWRTLRQAVQYVAIYPARVLWILDSTENAAYYASVASAEAARFVVAATPMGMPHFAPRLLAWNASCEWSPLGFEAKTLELIRGAFVWSASVPDRELLRAAVAPNGDIVLDEWPTKREMAPLGQTVRDVERYVAGLVSRRRHDDKMMMTK